MAARSARFYFVVRALGLALGAAVALGSGSCSRSSQSGHVPGQAPSDSAEALALVVEQKYAAAAADSTNPGALGADVQVAVQRLLAEVLSRERPVTGWQVADLEGALQQRGLIAEVRELQPGETPWLVLASGPKRDTAADFAWLVNARSGAMRPIDPEPFRSTFQMAVWPDSAGRRLLITGRRRSPAGPQPAAWLFRVPTSDSTAVLEPEGNWGLSGVGSPDVEIVRVPGKPAPRVAVTSAVLPNPLFDECASCPHLQGDVMYRIDGAALVVEGRRAQDSPYAAFVHLIEALAAGDEHGMFAYAANADVVSQARALGLDRRASSGRWRIAPGSAASSLDQIYLHGEDGAYRVLAAPGDSGFVITSISATTFKLD
ncbi:MAG TPA: hypothetical protein VKF80_11155 [Candidatus Eisenbacteria bacterium]|nr:hypothetical protein [Candidatus Eisenbacteria bacterium]